MEKGINISVKNIYLEEKGVVMLSILFNFRF